MNYNFKYIFFSSLNLLLIFLIIFSFNKFHSVFQDQQTLENILIREALKTVLKILDTSISLYKKLKSK